MSIMSIIDGSTSTIHCGNHDFKTEDPKTFEQHLIDEEHFDVGYSPCAICGKRYTYALEDKVPSILTRRGLATHPECKKKVGL